MNSSVAGNISKRMCNFIFTRGWEVRICGRNYHVFFSAISEVHLPIPPRYC